MRDSLNHLKREKMRCNKAIWNNLYDGERIYNSPNIVNLCLDSYDGEEQRGSLYHQYTASAVPFASLLEAMGEMERLYDELQFPQAASRIRSFRQAYREQGPDVDQSGKILDLSKYRRKEVRKMVSFDEVVEHRGTDATFLIRVKHRQNSSWQGEVTWIDGQKKEYFRSALELIRLIDSAMEGENN